MEPITTSTIYTIGHSTRSAGEFIRLLQRYDIRCVADVRSVPRSKRNPQFNSDALPGILAEAGIGYTHISKLGGFRRPQPDSPNTGWHNDSFRGFADYMQTEGFREGLAELLAAARRGTAVILCAEAAPWRCHRSLIADALLAEGIPVKDILDLDHSPPHRMTPFARWNGSHLTYPESGAADPGGGTGV